MVHDYVRRTFAITIVIECDLTDLFALLVDPKHHKSQSLWHRFYPRKLNLDFQHNRGVVIPAIYYSLDRTNSSIQIMSSKSDHRWYDLEKNDVSILMSSSVVISVCSARSTGQENDFFWNRIAGALCSEIALDCRLSFVYHATNTRLMADTPQLEFCRDAYELCIHRIIELYRLLQHNLFIGSTQRLWMCRIY